MLPSCDYAPEAAARLCALLCEGDGLRAIAARPDMPDLATIGRWLAEAPDFRGRYAAARRFQADILADDIVAIADSAGPSQIAWARLRIEARKWRVGVLAKSIAAAAAKRPAGMPDSVLVKLREAEARALSRARERDGADGQKLPPAAERICRPVLKMPGPPPLSVTVSRLISMTCQGGPSGPALAYSDLLDVRLFAGEPENMALTLQDLFVSLDTGAPQPGPRANAPSKRANDPFDTLVADNARRPAPARADAAAPPRDAAPVRKRDDAPDAGSKPETRNAPPSNARKTDAATSAQATDAGDDRDAAADRAATDRADDANGNADAGRKPAADKSADGDDGDATDAVATAAPIITNLFQVTQLAAEADAATGVASVSGVAPAAAPAAAAPAAAPPGNAADALAAATVANANAAANATATGADPASATAPAVTVAQAGTPQIQTGALAATAAAQTAGAQVADILTTATATASAPTTTANSGKSTNPSAPAAGNIAIVAAPTPTASAEAAAAAAAASPTTAAPATTAQTATAAPQAPVPPAPETAIAAAAATAAQAERGAQPRDTASKPATDHDESAPAKDGSKSKTAAAGSAASAAQAQAPAVVLVTAPPAPPQADLPAAATTDGAASAPADGTVAGLAPLGAAGANPLAHQVYAQATDRAAALPQVTIDQVAMQLTKAAADGIDHLTIHLKPDQLGAIEVKIEMKDSGLAKATISADRPDTLDLLQRDSYRLERALENAGIKADAGSLSFNLRDGGSRYLPYAPPDNGGSHAPRFVRTEDSLPTLSAALGYINSRVALGGVDIRV